MRGGFQQPELSAQQTVFLFAEVPGGDPSQQLCSSMKWGLRGRRVRRKEGKRFKAGSWQEEGIGNSLEWIRAEEGKPAAARKMPALSEASRSPSRMGPGPCPLTLCPLCLAQSPPCIKYLLTELKGNVRMNLPSTF